MVSVYEEAGVTVHLLEPDPALPYQVYARDSSAMTPSGPIVTQLRQDWRRGEYAPVIRFYEQAGIPIRGMVTAGALEGGDYLIVEPGVALIGHGEERTQSTGAAQLAGWLRADGWEVRTEPIPAYYVHMDVLVCPLAPKLAAVCEDVVSGGLLRWLKDKGFQTIPVPAALAFELGVNVVSLGGDRVVSSAGAAELNVRLRAHGLTVLDPDLASFTLGGGGAHCLTQPLRRERVGGA
jgi:N-dimethylarginine dimethylaminohydrolase